MQLRPANERPRWRPRYQEPPPKEVSEQRFIVLKILLLVLFGVLALYLARMQLIQHEEYAAMAENNRLRRVPVLPARGHIFDRHGEQLVHNVPIFSAGVVPADVPDNRFLSVVAELSSITGEPPQEIADAIIEASNSDDPFTPVIVKADIDEETAFRLRELQSHLPGVEVVVESKRDYVTGPLTSLILGYVGPISKEEYAELKDEGYHLNDRLGKTGVEYTYERVLRGTPGYDIVEVDAAGRPIETVQSVEPRPGGNLVLSLDLDLQRQVTEILREGMGESENAAAVVMDVNTGEVLSMVSLPAYDNNDLTHPVNEEAYLQLLEDPAKPLINHAIAEVYAPGSTFKMVTGTAALQEGVATTSTTITSRGSISVPNEFGGGAAVFYDWSALGTLDFYGGLAWSSDVYYYYLSGGYGDFQGLGASRLARYAREYGLGRPTGIDLPGEAPGIVPDPEWKEETFGDPWYLGDTYNYGIGQGYLAVTPLQLLNVTATVANGGNVMVPHVVKEIVDEEGNVLRRIEPEVSHEVPISDENLAIMREAMRQAASYGTATRGASTVVETAGKTGTAEFGPRRADGEYDTHAWYTGFAPVDDPQIAVVVFLEMGEGGGASAGPISQQIFDYYFGRQRFAEEGGQP